MKSNPAKTIGRSPLALVVLGQFDEGPSHPYQVHRTLIERGKDQVVEVRPAAVYRTVVRLAEAGLIEMVGTDREGRRPERTVYRITDSGREVVRDWLTELLGRPAREYPEFPAALSLLPLLEPRRVAAALRSRAAHLAGEVARTEASGQAWAAELPRLFLIEDEFRLAMLRAELRWVQSLIEDLEQGRLHWERKAIPEVGRQLHLQRETRREEGGMG